MKEKQICTECGVRPVRSVGLCKNCYARKVYHRSKTESSISIAKLQKGWTRGGGANKGYYTPQENKQWNCQACGLVQSPMMPSYLFPFDESEILKICPLCQSFVNTREIREFTQLLELVREKFEGE